jgi:hypothetical protein
MCVKRHSAMPLRRIPPIHIDMASDQAAEKNDAALLVRKDHPAKRIAVRLNGNDCGGAICFSPRSSD